MKIQIFKYTKLYNCMCFFYIFIKYFMLCGKGIILVVRENKVLVRIFGSKTRCNKRWKKYKLRSSIICTL
jgi:hypothetical protein